MIATLVLTTIAVVLAVLGLPARSALRPALLHNAAWAVALLIVTTGLLGFNDVSLGAASLIGASIVLVNAGVAVGVGSRPTSDGHLSQVRPVALRHFVLLILLFFIGVSIYLHTISTLFGLDVLLTDPTRIRAVSDINYLQEFPLYGKLLFYLGPLCLVLTAFPDYVSGLAGRPWRLPLLAALAGAQVLTLQRTNLFVALVWIAGLMVLGHQPVWLNSFVARVRSGKGERRTKSSPGRRIIATALVGGVALLAFQGLAQALGKTGTEDPKFMNPVDSRIRYSAWVTPMFYAASGVPAFSNLVGSDLDKYPPEVPLSEGDYNPQTWGAATFSGFLRVVPGVRPWNEVAPFTRIPQRTNVYTWIEPWYRDFREAGVLIASLMMGVVIGAASRCQFRGLAWQLNAGLLVGLSFLATFVNRYGMVMSIVLYFAVTVLGFLNRERASVDSLRARGAAKTLYR